MQIQIYTSRYVYRKVTPCHVRAIYMYIYVHLHSHALLIEQKMRQTLLLCRCYSRGPGRSVDRIALLLGTAQSCANSISRSPPGCPRDARLLSPLERQPFRRTWLLWLPAIRRKCGMCVPHTFHHDCRRTVLSAHHVSAPLELIALRCVKTLDAGAS